MTYKKDFWEELTSCIDNLVEKGEIIKKEDLIKFRDKNKEKVDYLIKNDEITAEEFKLITDLINYLWTNFSTDENLEPVPVFQEILKRYIALALRFNVRLERYINQLDHSTAYYKRIKALQMIRFYRWPIDEFKYIFWDLCYLLWESIEQEPEKAKESYNIMKEYLTTLDSFWVISWVYNFISLTEYSNSKYRIKLVSNRTFKKRFQEFQKEIVKNNNYTDEKVLDKAIEEKINNIEKSWNNILDRDIIYKHLKPYIEEYKKIKEEYEKQCKVTENITDDMLWDYIHEYTENSIEEAIENLKFWLSNSKFAKDMNRIIIEFNDDINEEDQKNIIEKLNKELTYPVVNGKDVEFSGEREYIKLNSLMSWVEYYYNEVIRNLVKICSNSKDVLVEDNYDNEFQRDIKELEWAKKTIEKLQNKIRDYEKIDNDKNEKIIELIDNKAKLESIIESNNIKDDRYNLEMDIRERRKLYRITVIWWHEDANNKYNKFMKDIKNQKLLSDLDLSVKQFDLIWSYDKQKNTNIRKKIEDDLIYERVNFIIALQTDHGTELNNLINDIRNGKSEEYRAYQYRLTVLWEPWDDWKEIYHDQVVTNDRLLTYIKKARDKYETHIENNEIGL